MQHQNRIVRGFFPLIVALFALSLSTNASAGKKRKEASAANKAAAEKFCQEYRAANPGAACKVDKRTCPKGYVAERKWKGKGINYSACVQGKKRQRSEKKKEQGEDAARAWCAEYSASSGESCEFVKTAHQCPKGYRRYTRIKNSNIRNYKICVKGKKTLKKKQVVKNNTKPSDAALTTRALTWLREHYDDVTDDFVIEGKDGKTKRTSKRLSRKFDKVKVVWHSENDKGCKPDKVLGYRASGQPRTVHICTKRQFPGGTSSVSDAKFCSFVGTIFHEIAHTARVPKSKVHNDASNPDRTKDHVYQLGIKAENACRADLGVK